MEASTTVAPESDQVEPEQAEQATEEQAAAPAAPAEPAVEEQPQEPAPTPGVIHMVDGKQLRVASVEEFLSQLEKDVIDVVREHGGPISLLKHAIVAFERQG